MKEASTVVNLLSEELGKALNRIFDLETENKRLENGWREQANLLSGKLVEAKARVRELETEIKRLRTLRLNMDSVMARYALEKSVGREITETTETTTWANTTSTR